MLIDSRYKVIERIGSGAWSTVYKVVDLRTESIFALKLFHKLDSETVYEKFSAEDMFIITKVEHPNLLKVFNFGNHDNHIYSLNEFCEGKPLSNFNYSLNTQNDFYWIIVQVCYGLHELHRRGIIHKDLKPDNIMYHTEEDQVKVKILDFGFTKIDLDKNQQHISGTLPYIAPEVFQGKGATPESDFYSLGVTLYKIVTGILPYSLEQLSDMVMGNKTSVFPKFPTELNPTIPPKLEKLILKLMEKNKEDRFPDSYSIISYLNRIQHKQYRFSQKFSLINSIEHSSYLIREDYTHQLLGYLPLVKKGNGKVVILTGEEGCGKNSILTLFRYHLLTNEYFLFDYTCTSKQKHPFFALIREFLLSLKDDQIVFKDLSALSKEFKQYLITDKDNLEKFNVQEDNLKNHKKHESHLEIDYSFAKNFLENLSEERPLIFVIRVGYNLTKETIGFINYISTTIKTNRIMIILSLDNPGIVSGLIHTVHIPIQPLSNEQLKTYTKHLLNAIPPDDYCQKLLLRSNGNPSYIRKILVDLIRKKKLNKNHKLDKTEITDKAVSTVKTSKGGEDHEYVFTLDWDSYKLPSIILHNIYNKLSHLSTDSYQALQFLSIAYTPLSKDLIHYLLKIDDKSLFFLLQDCINKHILIRKDDQYYFSYPEARERLFKETTEATKVKISEKILRYFDDREVVKIPVCEGLIQNARIAKHKTKLRSYLLQLARLYIDEGEREKSFKLLCDVITLDFSRTVRVTEKDVLLDLDLFQETAELTGKTKAALELFDSIPSIPDIFEKYYIKGVLLNASENYKEGRDYFEESLSKVITGKQRINAMINMVWSNLMLNDFEKAYTYINILDDLKMSQELKVAYIDRKAILLFRTGHVKEAIQLMENFKQELTSNESAGYCAKTGSFYNNLALFYSSQKSYDEANQYFMTAKNIWENINYKRSLGLSYNNLGDLALRQGYTGEALNYFKKALDICRPIENIKCQILTHLNFGEAYIKLGKYEEAESYLIKAKELQKQTKDRGFWESIIHNLAIVKNKTHNFNNYYDFIKEYTPNLLKKLSDYNLSKDGSIPVDPLIKTYLHFLLDIGHYEKVSEFLKTNTKLDFTNTQEEEFYHQMLGLLNYEQNKLNDALYHLQSALSYAEQNRSTYAKSIIYLKMIHCYLAMGDIDKSKQFKKIAEKLIRKYHYNYWYLELRLLNIKIDMLDEKENLRTVLRDFIFLLKQAKQNRHYLLEIDCYHNLSLIYRVLKSRKNENRYRSLYDKAIKEAVSDLPVNLQEKFLEQKTKTYKRSLLMINKTGKFSKENIHTSHLKNYVAIVPRQSHTFEPWQEHLYGLLKLEETERLKFFIKKMLVKMFAPYFFSLYLYDNKEEEQEIFINYRFNKEIERSKDNKEKIKECVRLEEIISTSINDSHALYIPLRFKSIKVGTLVIGDAGELPFTRKEIKLAHELRLHLTSLLIHIKDIMSIEKNTRQMRQLMVSTNEIFSLRDIEKIEQEMISFCVNKTGCSRAFLIKKDSYGNFVYQIAMDSDKNIISDYSQVSKTVLSEVYNRLQFVYTLNAMADSTLKNSISVQDYRLHSIYCAPIMIEKDIHALLYLDNQNNKNIDLQINLELMEIFRLQISIALNNARQYAALMKKNMELHTLDTAKTEFIALISHELNTPLMTLQNYIGELKDNESIDKHEREKIFKQVDRSLSRIISKVNDIISFTKYSLLSTIQKDKVDIRSVLENIKKEVEQISVSRNMIFHLEVKDKIPPIDANWESLYLMIYQIVLNAIRYTKDFGSIHIGARRSSFQDEEIDNRESLVIYVQDNGMGIPSKDLGKIFTPFKELNNLYSHQSGTIEFRSSGLGLGLSTAQRIAKLHSGKVNVKSKEGEGTTVYIILPFSNKENIDNEDKNVK